MHGVQSLGTTVVGGQLRISTSLPWQKYLGFNVVKGWWADDREADEKHVGLRVGEWPKSIVVFLSSGIPKPQADRFAVDHHTR